MRPLLEKIAYTQKASFEIREFKLPHFDTPLHFHPELELTWILAGKGKRIVGDSITDFGEGDLVFIGPNLPHHWHTDKEYAREKFSHSIVIQFSENFLGEKFFKIPEMNAIYKLIEKTARGICIDTELRAEITGRMQKLLLMEGSKRIFELLLILDLLAQSENHIPLASHGFNQYINSSDCQRINKVCQYVFDNFKEDLSLNEAASLTHMSTAAFCFFFKKRTRKNFSQFVNEIRIGHACKLLMDTDQTISEICYASGFKNLSNFNRRFKELHEVSPVIYRKNFKRKNYGITFW